jgi:hypothetical protein
MKINKITHGFVIQTWDTELNRWISQEFVAGEPVAYEDRAGNPVNAADIWPGEEPYLPFEMALPDPVQKLEKALSLLAETTTVLRDLHCGYPPRECGTHPADCVTQNREFFESIGELGDEMRETWTIT